MANSIRPFLASIPWRMLALTVAAFFFANTAAQAGPPFVTDDPVPVDFQHWEVYVASMPSRTSDGWSGTLPHVEINYGAAPELQLHIIMPLAFSAPRHEGTRFGYGDTELGFKYRFVKDSDTTPDIGIFPLLEVPSGNASRSLGTGHLDAFFPLWIQKTFGKWTTYGGGGYWINPGASNQNWGFVGALLQRQVTKNFALGAEVFHETAQTKGGSSDTIINAGGIWDLSENYHILFTAGHTVQGPHSFIAYAAFQWTFGPEHEAPKGNEK